MSDVTRILSKIESGDPQASELLLPLVYDELRKLAAAKMVHENPGQTLQATALVHEAYLQLVGEPGTQRWDSRGHFFAAAAEAMRRILIGQARRKAARKRGAGWQKVPLEAVVDNPEVSPDDLIDLDEAISRLEQSDHTMAQLVKLRVFAGLNVEDAAKTLGIATRTAYREWAFAQAWLMREVQSHEARTPG